MIAQDRVEGAALLRPDKLVADIVKGTIGGVGAVVTGPLTGMGALSVAFRLICCQWTSRSLE